MILTPTQTLLGIVLGLLAWAIVLAIASDRDRKRLELTNLRLMLRIVELKGQLGTAALKNTTGTFKEASDDDATAIAA